MRTFLDGVADQLDGEPARLLRALASDDPRLGEAALDAICDPMPARVIRALLRDTVSPNIIHAGVKYNVIPGEATVEIDCRLLPGTTEEDMRETVDRPARRPRRRTSTSTSSSTPRRSRRRSTATVLPAPGRDGRRPRPRRDPAAVHGPVRDRRQAHGRPRTSRPTASRRSGSTRTSAFLERFHGVDERVGVDALRWGLPVLYDVVRRFCG